MERITRLLVTSVLYGLLTVLITCSNILIIVIFSRRTFRRKWSNLLLLGLAVVDLIIGSVAVPLLIAVNFSSSVDVKSVSLQVDIITGLTSIFTLAVSSLERMFAICWAFRHRTLSRRAYIFAICIPWILVIGGTLTMKLVYYDRDVTSVHISSFLVLPLPLILIAYCVIWKKQRYCLLQHQSALQEAQERKLAKTLLIIIGAFVVTWFPFQVINIYVMACKDFSSCRISRVPAEVFYVTVILPLSNSFVNFFCVLVKDAWLQGMSPQNVRVGSRPDNNNLVYKDKRNRIYVSITGLYVSWYSWKLGSCEEFLKNCCQTSKWTDGNTGTKLTSCAVVFRGVVFPPSPPRLP